MARAPNKISAFLNRRRSGSSRGYHRDIQKSAHRSGLPDKALVLLVLMVSVIGIIMVYDSSVAIAIRDFSDPYHFVKDQLRWMAVGYAALTVFSLTEYRRLYRIALPFLLVTMCLLILVFIPGLGIRALGAHRWLNFRLFVLQPAEVAKLSMILYLSAWFSTAEKGRFLAFLLLMGMIFGLIIIEPDFGTAMIIVGIALALYFLSGAAVRHFFFLFPILAAGALVVALIAPYRAGRIMTFLNPDSDPLGASYQMRQVMLGLGSGGWFGLGIGKSRQKYEYLPEANTDSIFAVIGEETGLVGGTTLLVLILLLIWRAFHIAIHAPDRFGRLLAAGIGSWFGIQSGINLAAMVALVPLTGVPLPLISYGGSGLVMMLIGMGILMNISRHHG
ncbi:putative lipid II flippase FtsW [Patescibacteria group bacterium]|nr:putative lipid II flippase FtsW [Patescibacteria group bacterium]